MGQSATILKGVRNEKNDGKSPDVSKSKTTLMVNTVRTVKKKTEQVHGIGGNPARSNVIFANQQRAYKVRRLPTSH